MRLDKRAKMTTLVGTYESWGKVLMEGLCLPEIDKNRIIEQQMTLALDAYSYYDAILGMDFLSKVSIVLNYVTGKL